MEFKIVVKALILNKNKLLVVRRSKNDENNPKGVTVPGGFLEFGEKLEDGVKREVKEEVGLDIEVKKVNSVWSFGGKEGNVQIVGISFLCNVINNKIGLGDELLSYEWVDITNMNKLDLPKWLKKEIEKFSEN